MMACKEFIVFLSFILFSNFSFAQNDCTDSVIVCGNSGFSNLELNGPGLQDEISFNNSCDGYENNSIWLKVTLKTSGTLGFLLTPESNDIEEDFDFFVFGPTTSCSTLGTAIRCSTTNPAAISQPDNLTGMDDIETDTYEGPGADGNGYINWLTVNAGETYYIAIDRPIGSGNFSLQWTGTARFEDLPVIQPNSTNRNLNLEKCATSLNAAVFNLTQHNSDIIGSQTGVALTYHTSETDALTNRDPILTPGAFTNTENPQTIVARLTNLATGCFSTKAFLITALNTTIPSTTYTTCDNGADGDASNGLMTIALSDITQAVFGTQSTSALTLTYYESPFNATNNIAPLSGSFTNTIAGAQSIYLKATTAQNCVKIEKIDLIIKTAPNVISRSITQCDSGSNPDGITIFDLTDMVSEFSNNNPNLTVAFFENGNTTPLSLRYTNTSNPQIIRVKVTNTNTGCFSWSQLTLAANIIPGIPLIMPQKCDVEGIENGFSTFNFNDSNLTLAANQTVAFYDTFDDALLQQNPISNTTAYPNPIPYLTTVFARIDNPVGCIAIRELPLIVNKLPQVTREEMGGYVCLENPDYYTKIDAAILEGIPVDYSYDWFLDSNPLFLSAYEISINTPGIYTVKVTKNDTGCSINRKITISNVTPPILNAIEVNDFITDNNQIVVHITAAANGDYVYALDYKNGRYQESNTFENVTWGIHDLYVKDLNACGIFGPYQVTVLGIPSFFSPNGDGYNDRWNLKGASTAYNSRANIRVFDKFGKLMKQIGASGEGWDGTYNNHPAPAEDYWYIIELEDGRSVKGHFSLKR